MNNTLLIIDATVNLALGIILIVYPLRLVRLLGLPDVRPSFYARVLGGVLFGIGVALGLETDSGMQGGAGGLGLAGAAAINLCAAAVLAGVLVTQALSIPRRGHVLLWGMGALLVALSLVELAQV